MKTLCKYLVRRIVIAAIVAPAVCLLFLISPTSAQRLKDQMITWSSFNSVRSVAASISHVYFATSNGITRYDKMANRWELPLTGADGLDGTDIQRIWATRFDDHVYAQTLGGYFEYDNFLDRWYPLNDLPEVDMVYSHITAPTDLIPPTGFNYLAGGQFADPAGRTVPISTAIRDNSGDIWIGTWGYGAAKQPAGSLEMQFLPTGLLQKQINAMYQEDSLFVVGGFYTVGSRNGITLFNSNQFTSDVIEEELTLNFPATDVTALAEDNSHLYIGTSTGLLVMDRGTQQISRRISRSHGLPDDSISCLTICTDTIFVGTARGLGLIHHDSVSTVSSRVLGSCRIFTVAPQDSNLWIATDLGALRVKRPTGEIARFDDPNKFTFGRVYDVVNRGNFLWMSTDNGILRTNLKTAETEPYRIQLLPNVVRRLAVNDEAAAITSDRGLTLVFWARSKPISREFTVQDGLPSDHINCLAFQGDYLWIGSDAGLTRFWWNNPNRVD